MGDRGWRRGLLVGWILTWAGLGFAAGPDHRWYLAVEKGVGWSPAVTFTDHGALPQGSSLLFGADYRARGRWQAQPAAGLAVGIRLARTWRADVLLSGILRQRFVGATNFLAPPATEPARGDGKTLAVLARLHWDLAGKLRGHLLGFAPHLGVGGGLAFHLREALTLSYPTLKVPHTLTTPEGRRTAPAWLVEAGFSRPLGRRWTLDLNWRYLDAGRTGTDAGEAVRVRPSVPSQTIIPIGATAARVRVHFLVAGMRWCW
ncbi:MAG TPA: hypothetical protein PKK12_06135 [Candidatus Aminicenantes bacterium]|nr:hypothetical protein [Candidatus Aminicenantes bacterium]